MDTFIQSDDDSKLGIEPDKLRTIIDKVRELNKETVTFEPDEPILNEDQQNTHLYVILKGQIQLLKRGQTKAKMPVDKFGPGDLLGLTSFWTHQPSFLSSRAVTTVTCLRLKNEDVEQLVHQDPEFGQTLHRVFISNLSKRYRRMIDLNIKVAELSNALEHEHRQLKKTMSDLEKTRNQLVHQEKLATLGQLLAGIAHEINNPCAALSHGVDNLIAKLPALFEKNNVLGTFPKEAAMLKAGLTSPYWSAEKKRKRMSCLLERYPDIKRSLARRIAQLDDSSVERLKLPNHRTLSHQSIAHISTLIDFYELGNYLRGIHLSTQRIHQLVVSLKNYGRHDEAEWQMLDLREGIHDTLTVLNNRLKHYNVELDLKDIPATYCIGSEINQVWTNLLINACQATEKGSTLSISTRQNDDHTITIEFSDTGTGIPEPLLEKIFELNFTTKKTKSDFGLGLGLAIAKDIIEKHGGTIKASNRSEGGACFTINIPIRNPTLKTTL